MKLEVSNIKLKFQQQPNLELEKIFWLQLSEASVRSRCGVWESVLGVFRGSFTAKKQRLRVFQWSGEVKAVGEEKPEIRAFWQCNSSLQSIHLTVFSVTYDGASGYYERKWEVAKLHGRNERQSGGEESSPSLERLLSFVTTSRFGIGLNGWAEMIWQLCPSKICVLWSCQTTLGVTRVVDVEFMIYDEYEYMINEEEFD